MVLRRAASSFSSVINSKCNYFNICWIFDTNIRGDSIQYFRSVCLGLASLYTFRRKIALEQINTILLSMGLPIVSCMVLFNVVHSNIRDVITRYTIGLKLQVVTDPNQIGYYFRIRDVHFFRESHLRF
jgi:hypothetical protein